MKTKALPLLLFFFLISTTSFLHAAQIDPSFKFSTIETEHFFIHYHQGLEKLARKSEGMAEAAHSLLSGRLGWTPEEKTNLVLIDSSDLTNGFATVLPYNTIYIYTTPPMPDMTIGRYDDWLKMIITHEYTHILTMDPARGYSKVMRSIFGKPIPGYDPLSFILFFAATPPNVFMPSWWLEGTATWAESQYSQMGRGKSTYYDMIFRMAVAEDNLLLIDKINGDIPYWPGGSSAYIYGLALQRFIAKHYGDKTLGALNIAHSGRAPYFINGAAAWVTGKHYVSLYRDMLKELTKQQNENIEALKTTSLTPFYTLDLKGERLTNPRVSRDGEFLALNSIDPHKHKSIVIVDKNGQKERAVIRRLVSDHNITWSPDGQKIFFTQADLHRGYNLYQDLYSYEIKNDRLRRLTDGMRVKDPDLSPDGKTFAIVKVAGGEQSMALLDASGDKKTLQIISLYQEARVSGPRWSPDGKHIVFSVRDQKGNTSLKLYNTAFDSNDKRLYTILEDSHDNIYPTWSPDGKFIIFTSDRTGVYNLFAYSLPDKKIYQVTNQIGGAFHPEVSSDGSRIYFSSYHSRGYRIAWINYTPQYWKSDISQVIKPYWPSVSGATTTNSGAINTGTGRDSENNIEAKRPAGEVKQYSALGSVLPRFWLPTLRSDHDGAVFGAFTAGQDVLGYHTYVAEASRGSSSQSYYYNATYIYDRLYPTFRLTAYALPVAYSNLSESGENLYEKRSGLTASVSLPIRRLESKYTFHLGYHFQRQKLLERSNLASEERFEGRRDNVFAGIEFNNALRYPYSISREEGRVISLYYRNYSKALGGDVDSQEYIGSHEEFIRIADHSILYTKLKAAASEGDIISQQAFQVGGNSGENLEFPLRGHPARARAGKYAATATLEFRQPIVYLLRGIYTKPFFFDRLHIAPFADAGMVWNKRSDLGWKNVDIGVGVESRFDMVLGYKFHITPALGIAHGITKGGETIVYINVYTQL